MASKEHDNLKAYANWSYSPQGQFIVNAITARLKTMKSLFAGFNLVQLHPTIASPWLDILPMRYQWRCSPFSVNTADIIADFDALPFDKKTIDVVILPFSLDCFVNKEQILDEVDRILKPMGFVIIISMNPLGLFSLAQRFRKLPELKHANLCPITSWKTTRLLNQYGFAPCLIQDVVHVPPYSTEEALIKHSYFDTIGNMIALPGGFYIYIGRKHEPAYRETQVLLQPAWNQSV